MKNIEDNFFSRGTLFLHTTYTTEVLYSFYNSTIIFHQKYTTTKAVVGQGHKVIELSMARDPFIPKR